MSRRWPWEAMLQRCLIFQEGWEELKREGLSQRGDSHIARCHATPVC